MFVPQYTITHPCETHESQQDTRSGPPDRVSCFFPSQRGVVEFQSHDNTTLLLAATGHLRDFIAQRLNEADEPSARADLAPITARILAHPTGSAFESDLFVLERARTADPGLYAKITHQNRRALLALNPAQGTWRVCETSNPDPQPHEHIVGPCLTSRGAQQLGEALDDVYELCRFPSQLALAPNGTPCAYKEMGRCPGACDGSEPMHAYHDRFNRAIASASDGIDAWGDQVATEITLASAALDFEAASRLKPTLDTIKSLPRDQLGHARSMRTFACVVITPDSRPGWALCWVFNAHGCNPICSIGLLDNELLETLPNLLESHRSPIGFDQDQLDRFSLIARHWLTKPSKQRKRRVSVLDMRDNTWPKQLRRAIEDAQSASDPGHDDEEHTLLPV